MKEQDDVWENRGTSALVYDTTYERHWDTWVGPKKLSLFTVRLYKNPDHNWVLGEDFVNALNDTTHVRRLVLASVFTEFPSLLA